MDKSISHIWVKSCLIIVITSQGEEGAGRCDDCLLACQRFCYYPSLDAQAHTQTFENGGANLRVLQRGANLKEFLILRPKLGM